MLFRLFPLAGLFPKLTEVCPFFSPMVENWTSEEAGHCHLSESNRENHVGSEDL